MRKQKHATGKSNKVMNYKGFNYSRKWMHSSRRNQVGSMQYSVAIPKTIYNNDSIRGRGDCRTWTREQWAVENLFNYFDTAKDMKKAIDAFIKYNQQTYTEITREVA